MDWYKTKVKYTLFSDFTDKEFRAYHNLMALTAQIETMPTKDQMLKVCHYKTLDSLQDKLNRGSMSLQDILNKVLIDSQEVVAKRNYWKEKKREVREKLTIVQENSNGSHPLDKIREDKIRIIDDKGMDFYLRNMNPMINQYEKERITSLIQEFSADVFIQACKISIDGGVRKISYLEAVLGNYKKNGCFKKGQRKSDNISIAEEFLQEQKNKEIILEAENA